jgi:hypothetical protein
VLWAHLALAKRFTAWKCLASLYCMYSTRPRLIHAAVTVSLPLMPVGPAASRRSLQGHMDSRQVRQKAADFACIGHPGCSYTVYLTFHGQNTRRFSQPC